VADRSYRLRGDEPAAAGMRRIARGRAERAAERLRAAGEDEMAAAIHGARKDLKKLRALLRLIREELGAEAFKRENRRYRDAARLLSPSRDAEVKLQTLRTLRERAGGGLAPAPVASWERMLESERDRVATAAAAEAAARVERALAAIEEGAAAIGSWPLEEESWALVEEGLTRAYREGREDLAAVAAERSDGSVHELRKRVKDLWYQLRLLVDAWPGPLGEAVAQLDGLAELLGDHHDLSLLAADLAERGPIFADREAVAALIARRQDELLGEAIAIGIRVYAEKPNAFRRRIRAYWRAWREE
jgi:CHAD domain-containing protein